MTKLDEDDDSLAASCLALLRAFQIAPIDKPQAYMKKNNTQD